MKNLQNYYRISFRILSYFVIAAFCLQMSVLQTFGQTKAGSLLSRLAVKRGDALKVSFTYNPSFPTDGQEVQFMDVSSGSPSSWQWDFGDGSTSIDKNPSHVYTTPGFRKVTLIATNGMGSKSARKTIAILPASLGLATFAFSPASPKVGQVVQFSDSSSGNPTSWQWDFGDGATSTIENPSHTYLKAASYIVSLLARNSAGSRKGSQLITIVSESSLAASFTFSPSSPVTGQAIQFTDTSMGSPTSWQWNFGDGTISTVQNPSHAFGSAGTYNIALTIMNVSGQDSINRAISVAPANWLAASFSYSPGSPVPGERVQFMDASAGNPTAWQWDFGDGSAGTIQNPSHTFTTVGSYTVTLIVSNNSGTNSTSLSIIVKPESMIIPSERRISWKPGIVGGIPAYPVSIDVTQPPYNAVGNGITDTTAAIQAAINACPNERAVYIPAGTFIISSLDLHNRRIALRGAGPDETILKASCVSGSAIVVRGDWNTHSGISVVSGAAKGSTQVTVANGADIAVGTIWVMHGATLAPPESTSGWCSDNAGWGSGFAQPVKVTGKNGNEITFSPELYLDMSSNSPELLRSGYYTNRCGIEDLSVEATAMVSDRDLFSFLFAEECWLKNVEGYMGLRSHVRLQYSKSCVVRDSYFHHAWEYTGAPTYGYGVDIIGHNADHLVENNIFENLRTSMLASGGVSGCVFGYNYSTDPQPRASSGTPTNFLGHDLATHGRHTHMNLFEGNIVTRVSLDNIHGSGSHQTLFRNWVVGKAKNMDFPNGVTGGRCVVTVMKNNTYENFVGNVLGYDGCAVDGYVFETYPTSYDKQIWVAGYPCDNGGGTRDTFPGQTILRHGNYDYVRKLTEWDASIEEQSLPNSLYLSTKPQFFGDLPWPCIGPDLSSVTGTLPAERRFKEMHASTATVDR